MKSETDGGLTPFQGVTIAVASGKGGTGKTMVSTNLYTALVENGHHTSLVDGDAEAPNDLIFFDARESASFPVTQRVPVIDTDKCTYCGRCRDYCNYNAIFILPSAPLITVMEELCHGCGACSVACHDGAITEKEVTLGRVTTFHMPDGGVITEARMDEGVYSPVPVIKAAVKKAGKKGVVIIDAPPGTSCPFIQTVSTADYVVLVAEPTPFGLSDLKQSVETLRTLGKPCGVVINKAGGEFRGVYDYISGEEIPLLMEIPFMRELAALYSHGKIASEVKSEWKERFLGLFHQIMRDYGNSSNQR